MALKVDLVLHTRCGSLCFATELGSVCWLKVKFALEIQMVVISI